MKKLHDFKLTQSAITYSKLTIETLEQGVKYNKECIHTERTKPNSLNYAYFRDMVICREY